MKDTLAIKKFVLQLCKYTNQHFIDILGESQSNQVKMLLNSYKLFLEDLSHDWAYSDGIIAEYCSLPQNPSTTHILYVP